MSKSLLQVSAAVEIAAGTALIVVPSTIVALLIGTLDSPTGTAVARLAGAALVTIGLICWSASRDSGSRTATGVVAALVFYNVAAVGVLLYACLVAALSGPGTWPAIALHGALAFWCLVSLRRTSS